MLPLRCFRSRALGATNAVSLAMYFGIFGSIFLLAQGDERDPRGRRGARRRRPGLRVHGGGRFETPQAFVNGLVPAMWVGAAVLVAGALAALLVPGRRREAQVDLMEPAPAPAAL